jgi:FixJ family two-component response regulator
MTYKEMKAWVSAMQDDPHIVAKINAFLKPRQQRVMLGLIVENKTRKQIAREMGETWMRIEIIRANATKRLSAN